VNPEAKNKPRDICPVKKGYGMGVVSINPITGASMYSVADKLPRVIPGTLEETKAKQQAWQSRFHSIKDLIQTQSVPFFVGAVGTDASFDLDERPELANEPQQLCVSRWCPVPGGDGGNCVDILLEDALRATNSTDARSACALLELAANAGALSMLVCTNQYRPGKEHLKSMYYGYPLIDTRILLRSIGVPVDPESLTVDETENYFVFETDFEVAFPARIKGGSSRGDEDDGEGESHAAGRNREEDAAGQDDADEDGDEEEEEVRLRPHLYISKDPFQGVKGTGAQVPSPDFMMVGSRDAALQKAYFARFVHPQHPHRCVLWGGFISMAKPQITMPGE
jgi:hypothetical protein